MSEDKTRLERFEDKVHGWVYPPGSYEDWSYLRMGSIIAMSFIIFLLSPRWMYEVTGRFYRMSKAKHHDGNLKKFYREEADREIKAMKD